ncbi:MAG TPA: L,D-transpeptidase [Solirubrobacteraceae bacterium]|jgi:hypothetical protein|nr:L,D-transpeptidase [Solirubrobacteraceae bacterium]
MSVRSLGLLIAGALLASAAVPAAGAETTAAPEAPSLSLSEEPPPAPCKPGPDVVLSNERTKTTWANPSDELPIYTQPESHGRVIAHTHLLTEDGFAEVYLLLSCRVDAKGRAWIKLRIPGRPNGRVGWVSSEALAELHVTHWAIVVNRRRELLTVYRNGRQVFVAPVGVGKPSTPTPPGHFWIRERFRLKDPANPYYPYAFGTSDYSTLSEWPGGGVVGIHGPFGEPQKIPGAPSHGCVRMRDAGVAWLGAHVPIGTPVLII